MTAENFGPAICNIPDVASYMLISIFPGEKLSFIVVVVTENNRLSALLKGDLSGLCNFRSCLFCLAGC